MRFTVIWEHEAEDKLASLWAVAVDRQSVSDAANWIDSRLRHSGETMGVRFLDDYFLAAPPIAVLFTRDLEDRRIRVVDLLIASPKTT